MTSTLYDWSLFNCILSGASLNELCHWMVVSAVFSLKTHADSLVCCVLLYSKDLYKKERREIKKEFSIFVLSVFEQWQYSSRYSVLAISVILAKLRFMW